MNYNQLYDIHLHRLKTIDCLVTIMAETFNLSDSTSEYIVIKVASTSRPPAVAGAITGVIRERGWVEVQAMGAGAVNQAAKALVIAHAYLLKEDIDMAFSLHFIEIIVEGNERTAISFHAERRVAGHFSPRVDPN